MNRAGNGYDNAKLESFWATLKGELIQDRIFACFDNRTRLHSALDYQSPVDCEHQLN